MTADHIPPKRIFPEAKFDADSAKHVPSSPQTESEAYKLAFQDTDFLLRDTLHKYQIYLVEKDETLNSVAYRLDSLRGVRNVDNLFEKYHAGAYGGVPALP